MARDRTALMIIRAWVEEGSSEPLRAGIRCTTDASVGFRRTLTVARTEDVHAVLGEWLAAVVGDAQGPG